jgi:hypothetical protein
MRRPRRSAGLLRETARFGKMLRRILGTRYEGLKGCFP